jgi:hypothetical protein
MQVKDRGWPSGAEHGLLSHGASGWMRLAMFLTSELLVIQAKWLTLTGGNHIRSLL